MLRQATLPLGAPACSAARATISAAFRVQDRALGWGEKNDAVSRLQGNHSLIAHRGSRIGAGHNGRNHPHRHADFPELVPGILTEQANRLHPPDGLGQCPGGKAVFRHLVIHVAKARFPHCQIRQHHRLCFKCFGDGLHNGIQLLLGHLCQALLGRLGCRRQGSGLLAGSQIFIQFHCFLLEQQAWSRLPLFLSAFRFPQSPFSPASPGIRESPFFPVSSRRVAVSRNPVVW